jgi:hypothetical protein
MGVYAVFSTTTYSKLDAGLKKILDQLRMPLTAALSTAVVGKRYSTYEWAALSIVFFAIISFYLADVEHDQVTELHTKCRYPAHCFEEPPYDLCAVRVDGPTIAGVALESKTKFLSRRGNNTHAHDIRTFGVKASNSDWMGLQFSLMASLCNCLGSLFFEKLMKRTASTPFATQKVQMELTVFPVALAMTFIVPLWIDTDNGRAIWWRKTQADGSGEGFFQGYTALTFLVISIHMFLTWMGGLIVKQFSALVHKLSTCFALLLTVFCSGTFLKACQADPLPFTMYCLASAIACATVLFGTLPKIGPDSASEAPVVSSRESLVANEMVAENVIQLQDGERR